MDGTGQGSGIESGGISSYLYGLRTELPIKSCPEGEMSGQETPIKQLASDNWHSIEQEALGSLGSRDSLPACQTPGPVSILLVGISLLRAAASPGLATFSAEHP